MDNLKIENETNFSISASPIAGAVIQITISVETVETSVVHYIRNVRTNISQLLYMGLL